MAFLELTLVESCLDHRGAFEINVLLYDTHQNTTGSYESLLKTADVYVVEITNVTSLSNRFLSFPVNVSSIFTSGTLILRSCGWEPIATYNYVNFLNVYLQGSSRTSRHGKTENIRFN